MSLTVLLVSLCIKILSLLMVLYVFKVLSPREEPRDVGVYTRYFIVRRRFSLLRFSLLFVAGLILIELGTMVYTLASNVATVSDVQLLISDMLFLGLIFLLTKIYGFRANFAKELESASKAATR